MFILLALIAFISGSLPFSYWLGKRVLQTDIRHYGDGNPGATNVFRAGGKWAGVCAALLDGLKGAIPVGVAVFVFGIWGWQLVLIAIAPILGHAFSPFLRFQGGKAVAVTFGIWMGLTIWEGPTVLGIMLFFWFKSVRVSGWAVILTLISLVGYLLLARPDGTLLVISVLNLSILTWKHRHELVQHPGWRPWYRHLRLSWHS